MATRQRPDADYPWHDTLAGIWCWHIHHDTLCERSQQPLVERAKWIREKKGKTEVATRLRLMAPVRRPERLPSALIDAWRAWERAGKQNERAWAAYNATATLWDCQKAWTAHQKLWADYQAANLTLKKARADYEKALGDHAAEIDALHAEECPDCPWDGTTIFPIRF
jgi:hypothetical protein